MNLGKGRLGTGLLVLVAGVGLGACALAPMPVYTGMYVVPHSQTAVITYSSSHGFVINKSLVTVKRIDGENSIYWSEYFFLRFPLPLVSKAVTTITPGESCRGAIRSGSMSGGAFSAYTINATATLSS